jgi:hypothetical protein
MFYPDKTTPTTDVVDRLRRFCDPEHVQSFDAREAMADAWVEIERLRKLIMEPLPKLVAWPEGHASDVARAAFLETLDKGEKQ